MKGSLPLRNVYTIETDLHGAFHIQEQVNAAELSCTKQMLVDSDEHAFIYIVEENGAFSYLRFREPLWSQLVELVLAQRDPIIHIGQQQMVLQQFAEELEALLYNIEGNSNYGELFVEKVETAFQAFYEANAV